MSDAVDNLAGVVLVGLVAGAAMYAAHSEKKKEAELLPLREAAVNRNMQLTEFDLEGRVVSIDTISPFTIEIPGCQKTYFKHSINSGMVKLPDGYDCFSDGKLVKRFRYMGFLEVKRPSTDTLKVRYSGSAPNSAK